MERYIIISRKGPDIEIKEFTYIENAEAYLMESNEYEILGVFKGKKLVYKKLTSATYKIKDKE